MLTLSSILPGPLSRPRAMQLAGLLCALGLFLAPVSACGGSASATTQSATDGTGGTGGTGGETASARCGGIGGISCPSGEFCDLGASCQMPDAMGSCRVASPRCTREYRPVCGCDGRTHPTACVAHAAGVSVLHDGECPGGASESAPPASGVGASCGSRGQAQCGEGTVCIRPLTAHCGETDAPGTCQVRPQMCPMNYDPVCGCDGHTYSNTCAASAAGASVRAVGECH